MPSSIPAFAAGDPGASLRRCGRNEPEWPLTDSAGPSHPQPARPHGLHQHRRQRLPAMSRSSRSSARRNNFFDITLIEEIADRLRGRRRRPGGARLGAVRRRARPSAPAPTSQPAATWRGTKRGPASVQGGDPAVPHRASRSSPRCRGRRSAAGSASPAWPISASPAPRAASAPTSPGSASIPASA